jgi:hemerythrin
MRVARHLIGAVSTSTHFVLLESRVPIIHWNSSFLIGINDIDQHHHHLVTLLNKIYDEHKAGIPFTHLQSIIIELTDYAKYHFSYEEELMIAAAFSGFAAHKEEHDVFCARIIEFQKDFKLGIDVSIEIISFLNNWISFHILKTDVKLGDFIVGDKYAKASVRKFN